MSEYNNSVKFSNPRREAEFDDWPFGRHRCRCRFVVETGRAGERVARTTENKARTGWNKPKRTTYADRFVIVDGDDSKTYLLSRSERWQSICIWMSDCQHALTRVQADDTPYFGLNALIETPNEQARQALATDADSASMEELEAAAEILGKAVEP